MLSGFILFVCFVVLWDLKKKFNIIFVCSYMGGVVLTFPPVNTNFVVGIQPKVPECFQILLAKRQ